MIFFGLVTNGALAIRSGIELSHQVARRKFNNCEHGVEFTQNCYTNEHDIHPLRLDTDALGVPVKLVGLGEGPDDLAPFDANDFVSGLLS